MPGRKSTPVHALFNIVNRDGLKGKRAVCKFCFADIANNGTRKVDHILNCIKCSDDIKFKFITKNKKSAKGKKTIETNVLPNTVPGRSAPNTPDLSEPVIQIDCEDEMLTINEECSIITTTASTDSCTISHSTPAKQTLAPIFSPTPSKADNTLLETSMPSSTSRTRTTPTLCQPPSSTKKKQSLLSNIDSISPYQNEQINKHLARAIFATSSPLSLVENGYWKKLFAAMRPSYKLPSRYNITNYYLNQEYEHIHTQCQELLRQSNSVALLCDGWTNIRNEAIINFIVTTPKPMFWKSLATGSDSHTGEYMCNEISKVIEEVGVSKVAAVCTDNAANMVKAWDLLQKKYPALSCYGCMAHGLNLIFTDALKIPSVAKLLGECTAIVKCIKNSHLLQAKFVEKQTSNKVSITLKLPVITRWGSAVACFNSLLKNKQPLRSLAIEEDAAIALTKPKIKTLLDDVFWDKVEGMHRLLAPIAKTIKNVEGDKPLLSSTLQYLNEIVSEVKKSAIISPLLKAEETALMGIVTKRRNFCLKDIHYAANLLDPRYIGEHLSPEENVHAIEKIFNMSQAMMDIDGQKVMNDLANYSSKRGFFSNQFLWVSATGVDPSAWWMGLCKTTELAKVASRILDLPATSAACERSFSSHGNIHSKKRNRLTNKHVEKLLFVSQNLALVDEGNNFTEVTSYSDAVAAAVTDPNFRSSTSDIYSEEIARAGPSGMEPVAKKRCFKNVYVCDNSDSNSESDSDKSELYYADSSDLSFAGNSEEE